MDISAYSTKISLRKWDISIYLNFKKVFMRKIIYVLVVVSIAIVNTVFTIRNSDEIVDLVSLKSEAFANNDEISGGALGPLHKFGCGIPEKVIVAYDSDNNPIFAEIIREGELGECEGKPGSCSPYPCTRRWPF